MFLFNCLERHLSVVFNKYGQFVARNSVPAIVFCILLNCLLGINIKWMKSNSDLETVYTPTNSQAYKDKVLMGKLFSDYTGSNFYEQNLHNFGRFGSLIVQSSNQKNILNITYENEIKNLFLIVEQISIRYQQRSYSYKAVCARRNNTCVTDISFFLSDQFWEDVANENVTYPIYKGEYIKSVFGGVQINNDRITSAKAIKIYFYLRQDNSLMKSLSSQWEREFLNVLKSEKQENISISFSISDSLGEELDANTDSDVTYFSLTFTLMVTYVSFAAAGGNCVSQRGHLGRAGVIATGLAILGAFGVGGVFQIDYVNIVGVMPFLIIGIGVDDMFVLMSSLLDSPRNESVEKRIGKAVQTGGVAVTVTSLTNITAFAVGTLSVFKSVRNFCFYTGTAVFLCYLNQMTFFIGCMSIHEKRVARNRHCLTCLPVKTTDELKQENTNGLKVFCCSGSPPETRSEEESCFERLPSILLPKLVLWLPMKFVVIMGFLAYVTISIWGVINLKQGLILQNLVSEKSYYKSYSNLNYEYFPSTFFVSVVIPTNIDYSLSRIQSSVENDLKRIQQDKDINDKIVINWLSEYMRSYLYNNSLKEYFFTNLHQFLSENPVYLNDVQFGVNGTIIACRFHFLTNSITDSYKQGQLMLRLRTLVKQFKTDMFVYSPAFIFFEQYVAVLPSTLQTVGIAIGAVFLVTCVFLSHPLCILFVTFSMAMIMLGVIGFMSIWGLSLSSITMIHIIMSVGFSVDYSVHICHAFLTVEGDTRNIRVNEAIIRSGGPIFNGVLSSLIGIVTLIFSESYVFNSFFKVMVLVILFGLGQAVFFLPVILSIVGPHKPPKNEKRIVYKRDDSHQINHGYISENQRI